MEETIKDQDQAGEHQSGDASVIAAAGTVDGELDARLRALPVMAGVTDRATYRKRKDELSDRIENLENIRTLQQLDATWKVLADQVLAGWPPATPKPKPPAPANARAMKRLLAQFMANCEQTFQQLIDRADTDVEAQAHIANAAARLTHAVARAADTASRIQVPHHAAAPEPANEDAIESEETGS